MISGENIDKWSIRHLLLSIYAVYIFYNIFYRKRKIVNLHNLPRKKPVIMAPNHQNALMDALALVSLPRTQTVFLARSDVFKGKFLTWFLTMCKILPIYRIRDGRSNLQKNDEVFDATDSVMHTHRNPLCIFPEGNHGDKRRLRPLVKGIFRIAFRAQEEYGNKPGVKIVPTGIDYEHYWKFRRNQLINFGEPIEVSEYWDEYKKNPSVATNMLRDRLAAEMKKVMINIESEEHYDLYLGLRSLYRSTMCKRMGLKTGNLYNKFKADKQMIASLDDTLSKEPEEINKLHAVYNSYINLRDKLNFRDWVVRKSRYSILLNVVGMLIGILAFPLALLGLINNAPNYFLPLRLKKGIKDTQFYSTAIFGAGTLIATVYSILLLVLGLVFFPQWWMAVVYFLLIPPSGWFMIAYRKFYIKSWARIRYSFAVRKKGTEVHKMKQFYDELIQQTDSLVQTS